MPLLCVAYPKISTVELVAVEPLDSLCGSRLLSELDETKPSWSTRDAVEWQNHFCHLAHFRKDAFEIVLCRIVTQIPNKDLGANNDLLTRRLSTTATFCTRGMIISTVFSMYLSFSQLCFKRMEQHTRITAPFSCFIPFLSSMNCAIMLKKYLR